MQLDYLSIFGTKQTTDIAHAVEDSCSPDMTDAGQLEALIAAQQESARILGAMLQYLHNSGKIDNAGILAIMGDGFSEAEKID